MKINDAGTAAQLTAENPPVAANTLMMERDTGRVKWGTNGTARWNDLPYWDPGAVRLAHTTENQANSTLNLSDVAGLSFPIVAHGIYVVEFNVLNIAAATTTGLVLAVNGPTSPTYVAISARINNTSTAYTSTSVEAFETVMISPGSASTSVYHPSTVWGYVVNGATAGTLQLRFRSEVDASAVTIKRGSWGRLTRLG